MGVVNAPLGVLYAHIYIYQHKDTIIEDDYTGIAYKPKHLNISTQVLLVPIFCYDFYREKVTPDTKGQERKESKECYYRDEYLRKQDISYLFNLLNKHIRTWWD